MSISFVIPGEPVPKGRPRFGKGRVFTPEATRDYEEWVALHARKAMTGRAPLAGAVCVQLDVVLAMPKAWSQKRKAACAVCPEWHAVRPDGDNFAKAVLDGCNGSLFTDDGQAADVRVRKFYGPAPHVAVTASSLGDRSASA